MKEFVKIPQERIPVLIGKEGAVKKELERKTATKITIREDVEIEGEAFDALTAANVVKAIARGFSPESAFLLLDKEYDLNIITLSGETDKTVKRLMGRVIGTEGKTRRKIEDMCGARISIYGKTISIIARLDQIEAANKCIETLLKGKTHGYAYKVMDDIRKSR